MRNRLTAIILVALVLVLSALACSEYPTTAEPPYTLPPPIGTVTTATDAPGSTSTEPPSTIDVTASQTPAATLEITPTATPSASVTPTQIVGPGDVFIPEDAPNRLTNGGFEGGTRLIEPGGMVINAWEIFYCDIPYTKEKCPARRRGSGNPLDLLMATPEWKPVNGDLYPGRVFSGKQSLSFFGFQRAIDAGIYQTINTNPGETCEASIWVQTWSANSEVGTDGIAWHSDFATQDQKDNSTWYIRIDPAGGTNAFRPDLVTTEFKFPAVPYDQWTEIRTRFVASGSRTTVFYGNYRLWPLVHNDNYVDMARVRCVSGAPTTPAATPTPLPSGQPTTTPVPTQIPPVTPSPTPNPDVYPGKDPDIAVYTVPGIYTSTQTRYSFNLRQVAPDHAVRTFAPATAVTVYAHWIDNLHPYAYWPGVPAPTADEWLCIDPAGHWAPNPDRPLDYPQIYACNEWLPLALGGSWWGTLKEGF